MNSSISACKLSPCLIPQTAARLPGTCSMTRCSKPCFVPCLSASPLAPKSILCEQPEELPPVPMVCTPPGRKLKPHIVRPNTSRIPLATLSVLPPRFPDVPGTLPVGLLPGLLGGTCPLSPTLLYFLSGRMRPMLCCLLLNIRTSQLPSRYLRRCSASRSLFTCSVPAG